MPDSAESLKQIGELMGYAHQQDRVNDAVLAELRAISAGIAVLRENHVAFEGHRARMHERFVEISTKISEQSLFHNAMDERVRAIETSLAHWRANMKLTFAIAVAFGTAVASTASILAAVFGPPLIGTLFRATAH